MDDHPLADLPDHALLPLGLREALRADRQSLVVPVVALGSRGGETWLRWARLALTVSARRRGGHAQHDWRRVQPATARRCLPGATCARRGCRTRSRPRAGDGAERSGVPSPARERSGRAGGSRRIMWGDGARLLRPLVVPGVSQASTNGRRREGRDGVCGAARRCLGGVFHMDAGVRRRDGRGWRDCQRGDRAAAMPGLSGVTGGEVNTR